MKNRKCLKRQKSAAFAKEHKYTNNKLFSKVKDHCHYTGKYRGAAYSICNLKYSIPKKIHVVFHNASHYNYHVS